jgi:hypothetical protein
VICEGFVQAVLVPVPEGSCLRFEYIDLVTNSFEELLPRKSRRECRSQATELRVKLEQLGSMTVDGEATEVPEKMSAGSDAVNGVLWTSTAGKKWINEYGLTAKAMRCLEVGA